MTEKQSPSQRLQARLAALGPGPNSPKNQDPAEDFIQLAEDTFSDPMRVVVAVWTKQQPDNFLFSRVAHDFSDIEAFAFKLVMVMAGLGAVSRSHAEYLIATITYADGKANVRRDAQSILAHQFKEFHQLSTHGVANQVPPSYADIAPDISHLTRLARQSASPSVRAWVSRYVGGQSDTATTSAIFSETPGPYALPLGLNPSGRTVYYTGEASLLTIAPPGKGKTQCHILPTLASYRGPAIVLDVKGECYEQTARWRSQNVGPVMRFNPVDPDNSSAYNPLAFVDASPEELWESSRFLADLLVVIQSQSDSTWETQGKDLLTLIIAFVASVGEPQERTMSTVLDLIATLGLAEMLDYVKDPEKGSEQGLFKILR